MDCPQVKAACGVTGKQGAELFTVTVSVSSIIEAASLLRLGERDGWLWKQSENRGVKRGEGECLELPVSTNAERKNFSFRVVSICMCSPALLYFICAKSQGDGQWQVQDLLWYQPCHLLGASTYGRNKEGPVVDASWRGTSGCRGSWGFLTEGWEVAQEVGELFCARWVSFYGLNRSCLSVFLQGQWPKQAGSLCPSSLIDDQFSL